MWTLIGWIFYSISFFLLTHSPSFAASLLLLHIEDILSWSFIAYGLWPCCSSPSQDSWLAIWSASVSYVRSPNPAVGEVPIGVKLGKSAGQERGGEKSNNCQLGIFIFQSDRSSGCCGDHAAIWPVARYCSTSWKHPKKEEKSGIGHFFSSRSILV